MNVTKYSSKEYPCGGLQCEQRSGDETSAVYRLTVVYLRVTCSRSKKITFLRVSQSFLPTLLQLILISQPQQSESSSVNLTQEKQSDSPWRFATISLGICNRACMQYNVQNFYAKLDEPHPPTNLEGDAQRYLLPKNAPRNVQVGEIKTSIMSLRCNVPRRSTTVNTSALDNTEWDSAVVIHLAVGMRASTLTIADGYKGWEEREGREEFNRVEKCISLMIIRVSYRILSWGEKTGW